MSLSMKQKQTHRHTEQTCGCQGGGRWGGSLGLAVANYFIYRIIKQKVLLYCCCLVAKSCQTFCDPMAVACQAPLSMGVSQARILE